MAIPNLNPISETSAVVLPATGSTSMVAPACPLGIYTGSFDFLSGASDQVAYTYQKLGGDILDIEELGPLSHNMLALVVPEINTQHQSIWFQTSKIMIFKVLFLVLLLNPTLVIHMHFR